MEPAASPSIRLAQLHLYVDNHIHDRFLAPVLTVLTAALLTRWVSPWLAGGWAMAELVIIAVYIRCYRRFRASGALPADEPRWRRRIAWAHGAHMVSWSSVILWGWVPGDFGSLMFTMMIHLGLISLTATMSNPHLELLLSDMAVPAGALLLPPLLGGSAFNLGLMFVGLFYTVLQMVVALKIHRTTAQALTLKACNEELIGQLEQQATLDALTGVAGRRHLLERAKAEIARAARFRHPMALVMLDIDHFKRINDTWGHLAGDRVIQAVAGACAEVLGSGDCLGRLGGEEFALVLPEAGVEAAQGTAQRLREIVMGLHLEIEGQPLQVTVSIGVAMLEQPDEPLSQLLHRADQAMYRAKQHGRNRVELGQSRPPWPSGLPAAAAPAHAGA
jgi:diguanylate cyclase (GGDEF)-like protein